MLVFRTEVEVPDVSGRAILAFMLNTTDAEYQNWWPGVHLAFHTVKRAPNELGNLVFFDEYVGKRRLRMHGHVTRYDPDREIVWQMRKLVRLPAWLALAYADTAHGTRLSHTMSIGFKGPGRLLDPLLRLYLSKAFEAELNAHAQYEFTKLGEILRG